MRPPRFNPLLLVCGLVAQSLVASGQIFPETNREAINPAVVRIVDYGHDYLRDGDGRPNHQFHIHRYKVTMDPVTKLWRPAYGELKDLSADVDGDGRTDDDFVAYHAFSLDEPMSPAAPFYDQGARSSRWYGGATLYKANAREGGFTEDGVNQDHDGSRHYPRDNWALFHEVYELDVPNRVYGLWLWKKQDFLNQGANYRVDFEKGGECAIYLQRYFMGIDWCRWVIRDGKDFFISEDIFRGAGQERGLGNGRQHILRPNETKWARYAPREPYHIGFDPPSAKFDKHTFEDVTAVGWLVAKDRLIPGAFGFKWYAFEVDATVHRAELPSLRVEMKTVASGTTSTGAKIPGFLAAMYETHYSLWREVFQQARSNTFVRDPRGYNFDSDGDMGSMDSPPLGTPASFSDEEPVTDLTLADALAWCNGLSELESKTPCYYVDPSFLQVFRNVLQSPMLPERKELKVFVKWEANGYRLPTASEWMHLEARGGGKHVAPRAAEKTRSVIALDLHGNVAELCGPDGDVMDLTGTYAALVAGEDFTGKIPSPAPKGRSPRIGFRVVRRVPGLPAPAAAELKSGSIQSANISAAAKAPELKLIPVPGTQASLAATETSYEVWRTVRTWGESHGYVFDQDGDMGSMDYWGYSDGPLPVEHRAMEPVTDITWFDAVAWCNALSEMQGRRPVYFANKECTQVYRRAFRYRPLMMLFFEAEKAASEGLFDYQDFEATYENVFTDPAANGYRLPRIAEYLAALRNGTQRRYSWGDNPADGFAHAWLFDSAEGGTHPVGTSSPSDLGFFDLEGNVSEMADDLTTPGGSTTMMARMGGSYLDLTVGIRPAEPPTSPKSWPYPDIGFRVALQTGAKTEKPLVEEPQTARTPKPGRKSKNYLAKPQQGIVPALQAGTVPPPQQGRVYRANLLRDGHHATSGAPRLEKLHWKFETGGAVRSSPVETDGVLYVGSCGGAFYAIDALSGTERWKIQTGGPVTGSAAVINGVAFFASEDGSAYAADAASGTVRWKSTIAPKNVHPSTSPAVVDDVVWFAPGSGAGSKGIYMTAADVVGLKTSDGTKVSSGGVSPQGHAALTVWDGKMFAGINGSSWGAMDIKSGRQLWNKWTMAQDRQFNSMVIHRDTVFVVGSVAGSINAMDPKTGRQIWQSQVFPDQQNMNLEGEPGHECFGSPAIADDRLVIGSNDHTVYCFRVTDGATDWKYETGGSIHSSPSIASGVVYVGSDDGYLYALRLEDGSLVAKFKAGGKIRSSPWPGQGVVFTGCEDGAIYAIEQK